MRRGTLAWGYGGRRRSSPEPVAQYQPQCDADDNE